MNKVSIEVNNQFIAKKEIKNIVDDMERVMAKELLLARGEIIKRTQSGQTPDGGAFEPYSKGYAKAKAKTKRSGTTVNLTYSGQMLQAIQIKVERTATALIGTLFFNSPRSNRGAGGKGSTISNPALARVLELTRPFFALSQKQIDKLINALQRK